MNNGFCNLDSELCECSPGFSGSFCEVKKSNCDTNPCSIEGTKACFSYFGGYECICFKGYSGETCDQKTRPCDLSPCYNNANCTNLSEFNYECKCLPPWTGANCDKVDQTSCSEKSCYELGTERCLDTFSATLSKFIAICSCKPGYTGSLCDEDVDECKDQYTIQSYDFCGHHGTCINSIGSFHCICYEGYTVWFYKVLSELHEYNIYFFKIQCL